MLIGIGNNYQVGKDSAAQALCRELGYRRIGFADKLKEFALQINPLVVSGSGLTVNVDAGRGRLKWMVQGLGWEEAKKLYPEVRTLLQDIGSAGRNLFGDEFWIEQALRGIPNDSKVVVSDVRYQNEALAIQARGGIVIQIQRPGHRGDNHASERDLDGWTGWDHVIVNDRSLKELEETVVRIIREELQGRAEYTEAVDHELGHHDPVLDALLDEQEEILRELDGSDV